MQDTIADRRILLYRDRRSLSATLGKTNSLRDFVDSNCLQLSFQRHLKHLHFLSKHYGLTVHEEVISASCVSLLNFPQTIVCHFISYIKKTRSGGVPFGAYAFALHLQRLRMLELQKHQTARERTLRFGAT